MLIVGLGNPGLKYKKTYHNMGFVAVDKLAEKLAVKLKTKECEALTGTAFVNGEKIVLAKPQTYMNLSGHAVKQLAAKYGQREDNLIVVFDDFALPLGQLRIRKEGGHGGHNGMKSIIAELGTNKFLRFKIGIGNGAEDPMSVVLSRVRKDDATVIAETVDSVASAIVEILNAPDDVEKIIAKYSK